jgi:hypothetical protein
VTPKPATKAARPNKGSTPNAISPARREAFAILLEIERNQGHSDDLLRNPRVSALSSQDRNLCITLVMGTLRWQILLDHRIQPLLATPASIPKSASLFASVRCNCSFSIAFQLTLLYPRA